MSTSTIPKRKMIDLHMHLIPGVDDGAEDEQMAMLMLLRTKDQEMICNFIASKRHTMLACGASYIIEL